MLAVGGALVVQPIRASTIEIITVHGCTNQTAVYREVHTQRWHQNMPGSDTPKIGRVTSMTLFPDEIVGIEANSGVRDQSSCEISSLPDEPRASTKCVAVQVPFCVYCVEEIFCRRLRVPRKRINKLLQLH